jgi:plastocyanin
MRISWQLLAATSALVLAAACGGSSDSGSGSDTSGSGSMPSATAGGDGTLKLIGTAALQFEPKTLQVKQGEKTTVEFGITGGIAHNVKIEALGVKDSDTLVTKNDETKTFSLTPDKTGEFPMVCTIHPGMTGTVVVS